MSLPGANSPPPVPPKIQPGMSAPGHGHAHQRQDPGVGVEDYAPPPGPPPGHPTALHGHPPSPRGYPLGSTPGTASQQHIPPPPPGPPAVAIPRSGIPLPPGPPPTHHPPHATPTQVYASQQDHVQSGPQSPSTSYQPPLPPRPLNAPANASVASQQHHAAPESSHQAYSHRHESDIQPPLPQRPHSVITLPREAVSSLSASETRASPPSGPPQSPRIESAFGSLSISQPLRPSSPPQSQSTAAVRNIHHTATPSAIAEPPPAVTACIDSDSTFATTWYWHPETPDFLVCSRCYVDHVYGTSLAPLLTSGRPADGKPRKCLLNARRMTHLLLPRALASGQFGPVVEYMRLRPTLQECQGVEGIEGGRGHRWYRTDDIPGFVCCQACYEENVAGTQLERHLSLAPEDLHPAGATWACDLAITYLSKDFEARATRGDWAGFVVEAKARLAMPPCPGLEGAAAYYGPWFVSAEGKGPRGMAICVACYCDRSLWSDDKDRWRRAGDGELRADGSPARCAFGYLNMKLCMLRAHELKDTSVFWRAVDELGDGMPMCSPGGIENGTWHTLPSDPAEFGICQACYITVAKPLDVARFFVPKPNVPRGATLRCCFNPASNRAMQTLHKLLEMYYTRDPSSLDAFVSKWSRLPPCPRDEDRTGQSWYGWPECTICPECHHNFASGFPSMVAQMALRDTRLPGSAMCEMYSPRMRALYGECASSGGKLGPLLDFSLHRRSVYAQTVPRMRMMLVEAQMAAQQQAMLNTMSSHYKNVGQISEIKLFGSRDPYTYGAPDVGYGFANMDLLQGERLGREAMGIVAGMSGATMQVGMLEQRWRAVE